MSSIMRWRSGLMRSVVSVIGLLLSQKEADCLIPQHRKQPFKEGYYLALRGTQGTIRSLAPDWQPWITNFLRAPLKQKQRLDAKIQREQILVAELPELSVQILELAKEHGRLTIGQMAQMAGVNRNTVKKHLQSLVAAKHLAQHGKGKGTWYACL
jgi:DNA-directed RNA polymerase specialized sigma24 family protein